MLESTARGTQLSTAVHSRNHVGFAQCHPQVISVFMGGIPNRSPKWICQWQLFMAGLPTFVFQITGENIELVSQRTGRCD